MSAPDAWAATAHLLAGTPRVRIGTPSTRGTVYRTRDERPLTTARPSAPAAVRLYDDHGQCQTLALDFDAKHPHTPADVARDVTRTTRLLDRLGIRYLIDQSPAGGQHLYIPLTTRLPLDVARGLVEALAHRFPAIDPSPHRSARTGCIRTPGTTHPAGGTQELITNLNVAVDVLHRRNPTAAITALTTELAVELDAVRATQHPELALVPDATGTEPRGLSPRLTALAVHGGHTGYRSRSEARQAVLTGAARAGWSLTDIQARIADGRWPGLASAYAHYANRTKALKRDWQAAHSYLMAADNSVRISNTSPSPSHPPVPNGTNHTNLRQDEHGFIRTWRANLQAHELTHLPGRTFHTARMVLRALAEAAHKTGSRYISFGCRSLALACGIDHSTVSVLLHELTAAGWIDLLEPARGELADLYALTIPAHLAGTAHEARWPKGKVHALRPAFRELGMTAAFVFEAIEARNIRHSPTTLTAATGLSRSAVHEALAALTGWGLVTRTSTSMIAHPEKLENVAEHLGAHELVYAQLALHRAQRAAWRAWLARFETDAGDGDPYADQHDLFGAEQAMLEVA